MQEPPWRHRIPCYFRKWVIPLANQRISVFLKFVLVRLTNPVYWAFNVTWFDKWPWLHWDASSQCVFCHICVSASRQKKLRALFADAAFISRGYQNWKDATVTFRNHEKSSCHKESVEKLITLPATTTNIVDCLSSAAAEERKCSQACFLKKTLHSVHFLAMQGFPLRGDGKMDPSC